MTGALYPFLTTGADPGADTAHQATGSTVAKATESLELRLRVLDGLGPALTTCAAALTAAFRAGGTLFAFGNGGSSTDAQSLAQLFAAGPSGRRLPAMSLTCDAALLTALANDVTFDVVFARQLAALARPGDIAVALSTSGGSANVLHGLREAGRLGLTTVGLAGSGGGRMAEDGLADHLFVIGSASVHRIQEAQSTACHVLWELVQRGMAA